MNPISKITLDVLYEHINKALKGSYLHNDDVEITARVKLTALPLASSTIRLDCAAQDHWSYCKD
jgi:hypothetical protein